MLKYTVLFMFLVLPLTSGCSVFMAASSSQEPDTAVYRVGTPQNILEEQLGRPISSIRSPRGRINTYQYFTNDKASPGRAATYALLDVLTLGIAEIFTTPIEALQGDKHTVEVSYDHNKRVTRVKHSHIEAPLPPPEEFLGLNKLGNKPETPVKAVSDNTTRARLPEPDEI